MDRRTIASVNDGFNPWDGPRGTVHYLEGYFTDGDKWSAGVKPENTEKARAKFNGLVGIEADFVLEHKGVFQDVDEWKLRDYPGKPAGTIPYPGNGGAASGGSSPDAGSYSGGAGRAPAGSSSPTYDVGEERRSIEAQGSRSSVERVICAAIEKGLQPDSIIPYLELLEQWTTRATQAVRLAARPDAVLSPEEVERLLNRDPTPPTTNGAGPAAASSDTPERSTKTRPELIDDAVKLYGPKAKIEEAWLLRYGEQRGVVDIMLAEITDEDLLELTS